MCVQKSCQQLQSLLANLYRKAPLLRSRRQRMKHRQLIARSWISSVSHKHLPHRVT